MRILETKTNSTNLPDAYLFCIGLSDGYRHDVLTLEALNSVLLASGHKPVTDLLELETRYDMNDMASLANDFWEVCDKSPDPTAELLSRLSESELTTALKLAKYDGFCAICGGGQVNRVCLRGKDRNHQELLGTYDEKERLVDFSEIIGMVRHHGFERATFAHILHDLYGWTAEQAVAHIEALDARNVVEA